MNWFLLLFAPPTGGLFFWWLAGGMPPGDGLAAAFSLLGFVFFLVLWPLTAVLAVRDLVRALRRPPA